MKVIIFILLLLWYSSVALFAQRNINVSVKYLGDRDTMQRNINAIFEIYDMSVVKIRDSIIKTLASSQNVNVSILQKTLDSLESIIEKDDYSKVADIQPLLLLLNSNNSDESPEIIDGLENGATQGTLNYIMEAIFNSWLIGDSISFSDGDIEAMIRFHIDNPAQTSETSWQAPNIMLFVFGDRLVDCLASKAPDKLSAFHKAVLDARRSAQSGPGPDEEAIPEADRPTAEQLRAYEATFVRLEALVATGALPESNLPSSADPTQASSLPHLDPNVQSPPKQSVDIKLYPTRSGQPMSSTLWSIIVILIAAAIGLAWLLLKKRK